MTTKERPVRTESVLYLDLGAFCDNKAAHPKTPLIELGRVISPINIQTSKITFGPAHDVLEDLINDHVKNSPDCATTTSFVFMKGGFPAHATLQS